MNRTIYRIYNPNMKCPNGYYHSGDHYYLDPGQIAEPINRLPAIEIIHLLNEELESGNHHSMMDVYNKLYTILKLSVSGKRIDTIFMDIWKNGGIIDS